MAGAVLFSTPSMADSTIFGLLDTSHNPLEQPGVVRGNLPLPAGVLDPNDTNEIYGIIDSDGSIRTAQTDVATLHPDGSVAIVELSAFMQGNASQGETIGRYKVTALPTPQAKRPQIYSLIRKLGIMQKLELEVRNFLVEYTLIFEATGPFGEKYSCNAFAQPKANYKVYKEGYVENTVSAACDLKPVNGFNIENQKEVPQLLSIRAFITTSSGSPVVKLDVLYGNTRVTNGAYIGKAYFRDLKVKIPASHVLVNNVPVPSYNPTPTIQNGMAVYEIVKAQGHGGTHLAPPLTWHMRKLAITTPAHVGRAQDELYLQGQGFAKKAFFNKPGFGLVETYNWENENTANYALGEALPEFSFIGYNAIKTKWDGQWNTVRAHLINGQSTNNTLPFVNNAQGHTMPWGVPYGGMTGGDEIDMIARASGMLAATQSSILWHQYVLGAYLDRNQNRFAITADGEPWSVDSVLVNCSNPGNPSGKAQKAQFKSSDGVPTNLSQDDPYGINASSMYNYHRQEASTPSYQNTLLSYFPIDYQHLIRFTGKMYFLIDVKNDPIAKYVLRGVVENVMATYTMYSKNANGCPSLFGSMQEDVVHTLNNPHTSVNIGRETADSIQAVAESYAAGDDAWRNKVSYWLNQASDMLVRAQVECSGYIIGKSVTQGKALLPPYDTGNHRVSQAIESARISNAIELLINQVYAGADVQRAAALQYAQDTYINNLKEAPYFNGNKIYKWVHVYNSISGQVTCPSDIQPGMLKDTAGTETVNDLLRGWDKTGDMAYINTANIVTGNAPALLTDLEDNFTDSIGAKFYWDTNSATALNLEQKRNGY